MGFLNSYFIASSKTHAEPSYSPQQLLMLVYYTCVELNWQVNYFSHKGIHASTHRHSDEVKILISDSQFEIIALSKKNRTHYQSLNNLTIHDFLHELQKVKELYSIETLQNLYNEIAPYLSDIHDEKFLISPAKKQHSLIPHFWIFLKPNEGYFFTPIILYLNILVFILMLLDGADVMSPGSKVLIKWGANYTILTRNGEWWRLLTACFVHIGILHLLTNMFTFIFISLIIEPLIGKWYYLIVYLFSGVIGSLASLWWHDVTISAGASGAIFGLFGSYVALLTSDLIEKSQRKQLLLSAIVFLILSLGNGMKEGVDNIAHIGGLISGFVLTLCILPFIKKHKEKTNNNIV